VEELTMIKEEVKKPIVVVLLGVREEVAEERDRLQGAGIPVFSTPEDGALALRAILKRKRFLEGGGHGVLR